MKEKAINKLSVLCACILLVVALSECKTTSKAVTAPVSAGPTVAPAPLAPDTSALTIGRSIFETACVKCHDLPVPSDHDNNEWVDIMDKMSRKAHLTNDQSTAVLAYITGANK